VRKAMLVAVVLMVAASFVGCGDKYPFDLTIKVGGDAGNKIIIAYGSVETPAVTDTSSVTPKEYTLSVESKTDIVAVSAALNPADSGKFVVSLLKGDEVVKADSNNTGAQIDLSYDPSK